MVRYNKLQEQLTLLKNYLMSLARQLPLAKEIAEHD